MFPSPRPAEAPVPACGGGPERRFFPATTAGNGPTPRLSQKVHPDLRNLFREAERVWDSRADLRALYGSIDSLDLWVWLVWHGAEEDAALAQAELPFPPTELLERVAGWGCSQQLFRRGGIVDWRRVAATMRDAGFRFEHGQVLEFGCGSGRILRHFARCAHACQFLGVDIDADAIQWSREHLTFAEFHTFESLPPTALGDATFDAAYSYSVFTHLPPDAQHAWLAELARVLEPGAWLTLTFHGRRAVERWLDGSTPSSTPTAERLRGDLVRLAEEGHLFYEFGRMNSDPAVNQEHWRKLDRALHGNTFLTRWFVEREWTRHFELAELHGCTRRRTTGRTSPCCGGADRARSADPSAPAPLRTGCGPGRGTFKRPTARLVSTAGRRGTARAVRGERDLVQCAPAVRVFADAAASGGKCDLDLDHWPRNERHGSSADMSITAGPSKRFSERIARNTQGSLKSL